MSISPRAGSPNGRELVPVSLLALYLNWPEPRSWLEVFEVFGECESCLPHVARPFVPGAFHAHPPPVNVPAPTNPHLSILSPGTFLPCCFAIHTFSWSLGKSLASDGVMAGQSRRRSRGSIFSFTRDAVRSLSRAGSRQGSSNSFQSRITQLTQRCSHSCRR
jgi:hypothetical protein